MTDPRAEVSRMHHALRLLVAEILASVVVVACASEEGAPAVANNGGFTSKQISPGALGAGQASVSPVGPTRSSNGTSGSWQGVSGSEHRAGSTSELARSADADHLGAGGTPPITGYGGRSLPTGAGSAQRPSSSDRQPNTNGGETGTPKGEVQGRVERSPSGAGGSTSGPLRGAGGSDPDRSTGGSDGVSTARGDGPPEGGSAVGSGSEPSDKEGRTSEGSGAVSQGAGGNSPAAGGSSEAGGASSTGQAEGSSTGTPTSGCGKAKPEQPPTSVDAPGTKRTFLVDVPSSYDASTPMPILFAFHGMSLTGSRFRQYANLISTFGESYIVIHPDALGDPTQWDSTGTKDLVFFDAMLKLLSETYCIDSERVFLTGHSSGGYFTNALGCQRGDVVRAVAPQSGAGPLQTSQCKGAVAAIILHGSKDPSVVPAEGEKSRDYWGKTAGCNMNSSTTSILNPVCVEYGECEAGHPLVYCPYDGDHNLWSDAPKTMFDFFASL
ncbi:prolyl oligopeptidase family serine peptidase [Myxococcota bacterium]